MLSSHHLSSVAPHELSNIAHPAAIQCCPLFSYPMLPPYQLSNVAHSPAIKSCPLTSYPVLPILQPSNVAPLPPIQCCPLISYTMLPPHPPPIQCCPHCSYLMLPFLLLSSTAPSSAVLCWAPLQVFNIAPSQLFGVPCLGAYIDCGLMVNYWYVVSAQQ